MPAKGPSTPSYSQLSMSGLSGTLGIKHLKQGDFFFEKLNDELLVPQIEIVSKRRIKR